MEGSSGFIPGDVRRAAAAWMAAGLIVLVPARGLAGEGGSPPASSLAPVDREAFRSQYGQEALFRLRLGVDAADPSGHGTATAGPCPSPSWSGSPQQQRFDAALRGKQYYGAGVALGEWRRLCSAGR